VSVLIPSSSESAISSQTVTNCLSHEYPSLNLCWPSYNNPLIYNTCLSFSNKTRSIYLQTTEVKLTGL
jgi:hypothetical protein